MEFSAIILAAGKGTRLKSKLAKPLHEVAGKALISWVCEAARIAGATQHLCVISSDGQAIAELVRTNAETVIQDPPLGTGHAVKCCLDQLQHLPPDRPVIILYADTPLIQPNTLQKMTGSVNTGADICLLGFYAGDPTGYGRIIQSSTGTVEAIIEHKDASDSQKQVNLVNGGAMAVKAGVLVEFLPQIEAKNSQNELYLTDLVGLASTNGLQTKVLTTDEAELAGVNDRVQLAQLEAVMQDRLRAQAMASGVTLHAPETVFISADTRFGTDVVIEPHVFIGPGVSIADNCQIKAFSHLEGASLAEGCVVGPYARLRSGTKLGPRVKIGNFVETKNAVFSEGAKANHLSYLGDATIGEKANIGAGTITCNYDGFNKSTTIIGAQAFIGSNSALVAPVEIGKGALIGAGSVITKNVADDAIGLTRSTQKQVDGGAKAHRKRANQKKTGA